MLSPSQQATLSYDPESCGAKCSQCPLRAKRDGGPIAPEMNANATMAVITEFPGSLDIPAGGYLKDEGGNFFTDTAIKQGLRRSNMHINAVYACRPQQGNLKKVLSEVAAKNRRIDKINKDRVKQGLVPLARELTPRECCLPRLQNEIRGFDNIIILGQEAYRSIIGPSSLLDMRGGLVRAYRVNTDSGFQILDDSENPPEGSPLVKIMPTLHPTFVSKKMRWFLPWQGDLARADRWFRNVENKITPIIYDQPDPTWFRNFIQRIVKKNGYIGWDTETNGIEPMTARVRCIGLGDAEEVVCLSLRNKNTDELDYYTEVERNHILDTIKWVMTDPAIIKIGQNSASYDYLVMKNDPLFGYEVKPQIDLLVLHRLAESEHPHNLGFITTFFFDIPNWKMTRDGKKKAFGSETETELRLYCAKDTAHTVACVQPCIDQLTARNQQHLIEDDLKLMNLCAEMHELGMPISMKKRSWWEKVLTVGGYKEKKNKKTGEIEREVYIGYKEHLKRIKEIAEPYMGPDFNPGSTMQLRELFFVHWGLDPILDDKLKYTQSGDLSTSDNVMRALLADKRLDKTIQKTFIQELRYCRSKQKLLGTYVNKLRYSDERLDDETADMDMDSDSLTEEAKVELGLKLMKSSYDGWDEAQTWNSEKFRTELYKFDRFGITSRRTNRMYPGWNSCGTLTGRFSGGRPMSVMNVPSAQRDIWEAPPGFVIVAADADQLELRILSAFWNSSNYLSAFAKGADPHAITALMIFGEAFKNAEGFAAGHWEGELFFPDTRPGAPGWSKAAKSYRNLGKIVCYGSGYGASSDTLHLILTQTEIDLPDGTTELPYLTFDPKQTREMQEKWLKAAGLDKGWESTVNKYRRQKYLEGLITGRRRYFIAGEERNEILNFTVQCVPGNVRILTRDGYIPIRELNGKTFEAWTGHKWATAKGLHMGKKKLVKVTTNHAASLVCDESHKFKVPNRSQYDWVEAKDLTIMGRVAMTMAEEMEFGDPNILDPETAYILGLYISDGSATWHKGTDNVCVSFAVGNTNKTGDNNRSGDEGVKRITDWAENHGFPVSVRDGIGCKNVSLYANMDEWCKIHGINPGLKARGKRIPELIWRSSLACRKNFIHGILNGDGHQTDAGGVNLHMCNPDLLKEIAILCRTIGIEAQSLSKPHKTNTDKDHIAYRLTLSGHDVEKILKWGEPCKHRSNHTTPQFECNRVLSELKPKTASEQTIKSRIRGHAGSKGTSPYTLRKMGASNLYDHGSVTSVVPIEIETDVFTLSVDDPEHQYVAEGFISKNCTASEYMNEAILEIVDRIPFRRWGPGTGIIAQIHDQLVLQVPESEGEAVAKIVEDSMNKSYKNLPGVRLTAKANVARNWKDA